MDGLKDLLAQVFSHLRFYEEMGVKYVRLSALPDPELIRSMISSHGQAVRPPGQTGQQDKDAPSGRAEAVATAPRLQAEAQVGHKMPEAIRMKRPQIVGLFDLGEEAEATPENPFVGLPQDDTLQAIREHMGDCTRCKLCRGRKTIVFGEGNPRAELMFIGEAPGAEEDEQGLPFVGRAGQMLTRIIEDIGLKREEVYITNVVKCRPPANRKPEEDEMAACEQFLLRQINTIKPKIICALGGVAAQALLKTKEPISKLRGRLIDFHGFKLIATFHPAYLLRNPQDKRLVWEDMRKVRDCLLAK